MPDSGKAGWLFLVALVSITVLGPLSIHMYLPIMPYLKQSLGMSTTLAQFTLSVVMFVMAAGTLVYGSLSDRFGRRRVLIGGLLLFGIGSAVCTLASTVGELLAGRLLQAAGAGCGVVLARAIARDVYGPDKLAQVIAYITVAYVLGPLFAPPIGGAMADLWGWQSVFGFAVVVCVVVLALSLSVLSETRPADGEAGSGQMSIQSSYGRLLKTPIFVGYALNPGLMSASFFALASSSSFLMADLFNRSASEYGLYFMILPVGFMLGNFISGRIGQRIRTDVMVTTGSSIAVAVTVLLSLVLLFVDVHPIWLFIAGGIIGVGQGISMPYAQAAAINVDRNLTGTASGIVVFLHFFGAAVSIQLAGVFYDGTFVPMLVIVFITSLLSLLSGLYAGVHLRRAVPAALP